jgi:hypothetical protein
MSEGAKLLCSSGTGSWFSHRSELSFIEIRREVGLKYEDVEKDGQEDGNEHGHDDAEDDQEDAGVERLDRKERRKQKSDKKRPNTMNKRTQWKTSTGSHGGREARRSSLRHRNP